MKKIFLFLFLFCNIVLAAGRGEPVWVLLNGVIDNTTGTELSNGYIKTYEGGTSTLKTLYTDWNLSTPATNPVQLNASGKNTTPHFATGSYKFEVYNSDSTLINTWDNLQFGHGTNTIGSEVLATDYN